MRAQTHLVTASLVALFLSIAGGRAGIRADDLPPLIESTDAAPIMLTQAPGPTFGPGPVSPAVPPPDGGIGGPPYPAPPGTLGAPAPGIYPGPGCGPAPPCGALPAPVCPNPGCAQVIAGLDLTIFHASTNGISNSASVPDFADPGKRIGLSEDNVYDQFTYSPRITLGVEQDNWGILGRFWYMSDSTSSLVGPTSSVILSDDQLKAYTADLELTHAIFWGPSKIDLFLGGRYAAFVAGQSIDVAEGHSAPFVMPIAFADALSQFSFYGGGLTTGFQGHTPLGWVRELNLVWGVRGSVLWGEAQSRIQDVAAVDGASSAIGGVTDRSATAYIVEALLGVEWKHELRWLPMSTYLRVAFEYQYWNLGSELSSTKSASTPAPSATASSSIGDVDMNLIGLTIGAGLNW